MPLPGRLPLHKSRHVARRKSLFAAPVSGGAGRSFGLRAGIGIGGLDRAIARIAGDDDRQRVGAAAALDNLRVATQNLRELSETARDYPSFLLLGEPPPKVLPSGEAR